MAFSKLLISLVTILSLSLTTLSSADYIDDLCKKTKNEILCAGTLKPDPGSHGANVTVLTEILLRKALLGAENIGKYYESMAKVYSSGGEMEMALRLTSCSKNLFKSLNEYNNLKEFLSKGDYSHAAESADHAELDAEPCAKSFKGHKVPRDFVDPIMTQIDLGLIIVYFVSISK